jgi:hypothetical protein
MSEVAGVALGGFADALRDGDQTAVFRRCFATVTAPDGANLDNDLVAAGQAVAYFLKTNPLEVK